MAIRERKGRKSPWQCYWNNPITGRRESANFATRGEAEKHDSLIKHRLRFDRESFRKECEAVESQEATLESCYLLYLREKQFSRESLKWQMDSMRLALKKLGHMPVAEIKRSDIERVMTEMKGSGVKPVTVRNRMSVLRTVLRWCAAHDYREYTEFPKLPPAHYEKLVPPTHEELAAIAAASPEHLARAVILGAQFGVRVGPSELFGLKWEDVDFNLKVLRVHGAKKNVHAPWREVPIKSSLLPVFAAWKNEDAKIGAQHIVHYAGQPMLSLKTTWKSTLRRAGITRRIRLYDLRHAFGTNLVAAGAHVGTVANLMGHSSPVMLLKHYLYVMDRQKVDAIEAQPDIENVPGLMCPKGGTSAALQ